MIRKNIRLRKEYLFKKQKEIKDTEKKLAVKKAIEEDRAVPFELRHEEKELRHQLENDDDNTLVKRSHIDDEYEEAKYKDPKVMITTSRSPSSRLMNFQKELRLIVPNSIRVNRGAYVIKGLVKI